MFVMTHSVLGDIGVYKPEILEFSDQQIDIEEGCLTFPLLYVCITRPGKIKVRYYKNDGATQVETWMDGMDARCFLHEYDHLQGKLYIDELSDFKLKRAKEKRDKYLKKLGRRINP
jgi:peptide deformylase